VETIITDPNDDDLKAIIAQMPIPEVIDAIGEAEVKECLGVE